MNVFVFENNKRRHEKFVLFDFDVHISCRFPNKYPVPHSSSSQLRIRTCTSLYLDHPPNSSHVSVRTRTSSPPSPSSCSHSSPRFSPSSTPQSSPHFPPSLSSLPSPHFAGEHLTAQCFCVGTKQTMDSSYTQDVLKRMTVAELRDECELNDLPHSGKKAILIERFVFCKSGADCFQCTQTGLPCVWNIFNTTMSIAIARWSAVCVFENDSVPMRSSSRNRKWYHCCSLIAVTAHVMVLVLVLETVFVGFFARRPL